MELLIKGRKIHIGILIGQFLVFCLVVTLFVVELGKHELTLGLISGLVLMFGTLGLLGVVGFPGFRQKGEKLSPLLLKSYAIFFGIFSILGVIGLATNI